MKQAIFALILLGAAACERGVPEMVTCQLERGCSMRVDGHSLHLRSDVAPQPARPFVLQVEAPHAKEIRAQFEMRSMSMATPDYVLQRKGARFEANVILPVCVSGRSDWVLRLAVDGKPVELAFNASS